MPVPPWGRLCSAPSWRRSRTRHTSFSMATTPRSTGTLGTPQSAGKLVWRDAQWTGSGFRTCCRNCRSFVAGRRGRRRRGRGTAEGTRITLGWSGPRPSPPLPTRSCPPPPPPPPPPPRLLSTSPRQLPCGFQGTWRARVPLVAPQAATWGRETVSRSRSSIDRGATASQITNTLATSSPGGSHTATTSAPDATTMLLLLPRRTSTTTTTTGIT